MKKLISDFADILRKLYIAVLQWADKIVMLVFTLGVSYVLHVIRSVIAYVTQRPNFSMPILVEGFLIFLFLYFLNRIVSNKRNKTDFFYLWNRFGSPNKVHISMRAPKLKRWIAIKKAQKENKKKGKKAADWPFCLDSTRLFEALQKGTTYYTCTHDAVIKGLEQKGCKIVKKKEAYRGHLTVERLYLGKKPLKEKVQFYLIEFIVPET